MTLVERLNLENQILNQDGMSQYLVKYYPQGDYYFIYGDYNSNSRRSYTIWCRIPEYYPNECPKVYVHKPNPLLDYWGMPINRHGIYHQMHTLEKGSGGEVQICHWRQTRWHSGVTLNKVMMKVMLWFEAYEQHLLTGQPISNFVPTMREA